MNKNVFYLRNPEFSFYYNNDTIIVLTGNGSVELNPLYVDVVEKCNGKNSLSNITEGIWEKYGINSEDNEARQLFPKVIEELLTHKIIEEVSDKAPLSKVNPITGKKGKLFPSKLVLELTNKCNFSCKHCFKDAKVTGIGYMNVADFEYFLSKLSVPLEAIEITGGECTLHPQINEIIEIAAKAAGKVFVLTNGSNIKAISSDKLSLLSEVQVSIYGYDNESYKSFTSREHGFDAVKAGLEILKSHSCDLAIAICITRENYTEIHKFIEFACQFNPKEIRFALVIPLGRASASEYHKSLELPKEELPEVRRIVDDWADKLSPHIKVRRLGDLLAKEADDTSTLRCNAGKYQIVISENNVVRPCVYLPEGLFNMGTVRQYANDISDGKVFDFTNGVSAFKKELAKEGFSIANMMCEGFCKIESSGC